MMHIYGQVIVIYDVCIKCIWLIYDVNNIHIMKYMAHIWTFGVYI